MQYRVKLHWETEFNLSAPKDATNLDTRIENCLTENLLELIQGGNLEWSIQPLAPLAVSE